MLAEQKPVAKRVPPDVHTQCCKWSQLLHNHYLQNVGQEGEGVGRESLTTALLANLLFPYTDGPKPLFLIEAWMVGLPSWYSRNEATCWCRRRGFDPWSGKIPHAVEQPQSMCCTPEPECCNCWSLHVLEPVFATRETLCIVTKTQHNQKTK